MQVLRALEPAGEFLRFDEVRLAEAAREGAEALGRHLDFGQERLAGGGPCRRAAVDDMDGIVAQGLQAPGGDVGFTAATIEQHHACSSARHRRHRRRLQDRERQVRRQQGMAGAEGGDLAHVDEREFVAICHHALGLGGGNGAGHGTILPLFGGRRMSIARRTC